MKTETQLRTFLTACGAVRDFGMSSGPCPMNVDGGLGCCAECSTPAAIEWVLGDRQDGSANGQQELINAMAPSEAVGSARRQK
jgi:hypothetical protein